MAGMKRSDAVKWPGSMDDLDARPGRATSRAAFAKV